ncbi:hypothetical protein SAMN06295910_1761 [Allosphingosinicella indica]|uniref:Uncharacterized protein n=1 Tax=Allosphingosinicella indica TaxID=941907 RepID=A0A1X7GGZ9_9SPHN|nr:hypothetical protein SAMN06295910_1761 [Allosphingosinicella indica]
MNILPRHGRGRGTIRSMVEGYSEPVGPSTALRAVPLPCETQGRIG